jgi:ankyrin repeat protein
LGAVQQNSLKQLCNLVALGANVNAKDSEGHGPLHIATLNKNMNIFHFLLHQQININAGNLRAQTSLHLSIINKQFDMFFLLLECGCNANAKDSHGHTPYFFANKLNYTDYMLHLVAYGAHGKRQNVNLH